MSFDISAAGGFGSLNGSYGSFNDSIGFTPDGEPFGLWCQVVGQSGNTLTLNHRVYGLNFNYPYPNNYLFYPGAAFLIHHSLCKSTNPSATVIANLGKWEVLTVKSVEFPTDDYMFNEAFYVTFDKAPDIDLENFYVQAVYINECKDLSLVASDSYVMSVPYFHEGKYCGGILALRLSGILTLAGGYFYLSDNGIPTSLAAYRPNTSQEESGTLDTDLYSGCENSITKDRLLLNVGDGALFLIAKKIVVTSSNSRIGNSSTYGVQYCRGASDSTGTPAGVTNVGGSTILIATNEFGGFKPQIIAKYRNSSSTAGKGLARAYIAVDDSGGGILPDEGLYALDVVKNNSRLQTLCNISSFGNGTNGTSTFSSTTKKCLNAYARVSNISGKDFTISKYSADVDEIVGFEAGKLVMIHQTRRASSSDADDGKFILSRIAAISGSKLTLEDSFDTNLSNYYVQIVVIPEFINFTLSGEYAYTPNWSNGAGGICAVACSGTCNLSSGRLNVERKGTFNNVVNVGVGNYSMKNTLPIGQGHGSVFILANNLTMNTSTRIGATYDGAQFGGTAINGSATSYPRTAQGGWKGVDGAPSSGNPENGGTGGSGKAAGICSYYRDTDGGWHSSAAITDREYSYGCQGAHVLIIADTITGLNLSALSTGGAGGRVMSAATTTSIVNKKGGDGGCGYGGGGYPCTTGVVDTAFRYGGAGGYRGGGATAYPSSDNDHSGGGAGGCAFVYANSVSNQTTTGLVTT